MDGERRRKIVLLITALCLVVAWALSVTPARLGADASQNVQMAYDLTRTGTISFDEWGVGGEAARQPSMYREPLPVVVNAGGIAVMDALLGPTPAEAYQAGLRAQLLKMQNIAWLALMSVATFVAARRLTGSFRLSLACLIVTNLLALMVGRKFIDDLYTDVNAAALLAVASVLLIPMPGRRGLWSMVLAGVAMGLLILTKASFLYVLAGLAIGIAALFAWRREHRRDRLRWAGLGAFVLVALLVTAPWMVRNHAHFGTWQMTERGGRVLLIRAYKDMMTPQEYLGSFYAWAPGPLKPVLGKVLGFTPADLKMGGRLQRLHRGADPTFKSATVESLRRGETPASPTYYIAARDTYFMEIVKADAAGERFPGMVADAAIEKQALDIIKAHPLRHLALTIPFLWRGGMFVTLLLAGVFLAGLVRRRDDLALYVLPALGLAAFCAIFSHFIPRYIWPAFPMIAICLVVTATAAWRLARQRTGFADVSPV